MISQSSLKIGQSGSKTKSLCKISLKHYSPSRGHSFVLIFKELYQNFWLDNVLVRLECGACRLKTRSLGHFSIKPCSHSRGHSFASAFMKLYQSFFNDILIKSEYGSCRVKNQVTRLDFFETFFNLWTLQFFLQSS